MQRVNRYAVLVVVRVLKDESSRTFYQEARER